MNTGTRVNETDSKKKSERTFGVDQGLQDKILKQIRELGDSLERAGEKVQKNGWETIGQAIYKLGNSFEHLNDKSNTQSVSAIKSASKSTSLPGTDAYTDKEFDEKARKPSDVKATAKKVGRDGSGAY